MVYFARTVPLALASCVGVRNWDFFSLPPLQIVPLQNEREQVCTFFPPVFIHNDML